MSAPRRVSPLLAVLCTALPLLLIPAAFLFTPQAEAAGTLAVGAAYCVAAWMLLYLLLPVLLDKVGRGRSEKVLSSEGFRTNQTFTTPDTMLCIDQYEGRLALRFKWNPLHTFLIDAAGLTEAHVEDGRGKSGVLDGTNRVCLCFTVDGKHYRLPTFTSNRPQKMDSPAVEQGVARAELFIQALEAARDTARDRLGQPE